MPQEDRLEMSNIGQQIWRSARSSSMQFGKYGVFQNAAERRIVNPQSPPILDVPELLELIHKVADAAAG